MKSRLIILLTLLLSCAFTSVVSSEIYKWKDSKGNIIFSDAPPAGGGAERQILKEQRIERPPVKEEAYQPQGNTGTKKRAYQEIRVVMYMTSWCPYCKKARDYINSLGVSLTEYDIEKDRSKNDEMLGKSGGGKGVPLIDVEGIIIRGYSPEAIKSSVEARR
jgi:glutaredoxin